MVSGIDGPGLYGLRHSSRKQKNFWSKNNFNSTFPAALACYMRDKGVPAVYVALGEDFRITTSEIEIGKVFNTDRPNEELRFDFESRFHPYTRYALGDIGGIDLVVKHEGETGEGAWRRPLEVKLTVMPDDATSKLAPEKWGPELVIRPASTKYCALGIYHSIRAHRAELSDIFQNVCGNFEVWNSTHELLHKRALILSSLDQFQRSFRGYQQPFLLQPIWSTEGKSPSLAEKAFDLFVWSDFALCRTFIDKSTEDRSAVNRYMRASARLARVLYDLSTQDRANLNGIYTEMAYGLQTDKEFSLPGAASRVYLNSPRFFAPALGKKVLSEIILNGGERLLSPERRFDATVYFTTREIFDVQEAEIHIVEAAVEIAKGLASNN